MLAAVGAFVVGPGAASATAGPPATISLNLAPALISANGSSSTFATVTVDDGGGMGIPGETITLGSTDGGQGIGGVTDHGDGTYTATITSSTTPGQPTITASDSAASLSTTQILTQYGAAAQVALAAPSSGSIAANGTSTSSITATVTDASGDPVPGETLTYDSSPAGGPSGGFTDNGDGTYSATIVSTTNAGSYALTAHDGGIDSNTQSLAQTAGAPTGVSLSAPSPASITANGTSTSSLNATVTDAHGNPVPGETLTYDSSPSGGPSGSFTDNGDGTYSATVTSTTTAGSYTLTAHDGGIDSNTQSLTQSPGPATTVTLSAPSPASITANGTSTSSLTATVTDAHGNPVPGETLTYDSSPSGGPSGSFTDNGDGTYSATVTSTTTAGSYTLTAHDGGIDSNTQSLTQTPGSPTSIALALAPSSITADGTSTSTATATVTDTNGNRVPGENVTIHSSGGQTVGTVTDNHDGTYTATITSTTTAGHATITAADSAASLTTNQTLTQTPGPVTTIALSAPSPASITANGTSTSSITATVTDGNGNPVPGETVTYSSSPAGGPSGSFTDNGNGTYSATITSTTKAGSYTLTAHDGAVDSNTRTLTQTPGPPTGIALLLSPSSIVADGSSTSTATATVTDTNGNGVPGNIVTIRSNGGQHISAVHDNGDGTYTATITSTTTAGNSTTITAADAAAGLSANATLTQSTGIPIAISLRLSRSSITADGTATTTATATVSDANANGISREIVTIGSSGAQNVSTVHDNGDGTYTATITSTTHAGQATITASVAGLPSVAQTLAQVAGPARVLTVTLGSQTLIANGITTTTATATVADANQNPIAGHAVAFSSNDPRLRFGRVTDLGNGTYKVTLTGSNRAGAKTIIATDQSASPAISAQTTIFEPSAPSMLNAVLMQWTFFYSPTYTKVLALAMSGEQPGATITIHCRGRGCSFRQRTVRVPSIRHCHRVHGRRICRVNAPGSLTLAGRFGSHHLAVGTIVTVLVTKRGWIGKYYVFTVRSGQRPRVSLGCLAPGSTNPAGGC